MIAREKPIVDLLASSPEPLSAPQICERLHMGIVDVQAALGYAKAKGRAFPHPALNGRVRPQRWWHRAPGEPIATPRGARRALVLAQLQQLGPQCARQVALALGVGRHDAGTVLWQLEARGEVDRQGRDGPRGEVFWRIPGDHRKPVPLSAELLAGRTSAQRDRRIGQALVAPQPRATAIAPDACQTVEAFIAAGGKVEVLPAPTAVPAVVRPAFPGSR